MHSNSAEPVKIEPKDYSRMLTGGWIALASGLGGALVLLTVGITTKAALPTGFAALTMGAFLSGCTMLTGRMVLRRLDVVDGNLAAHRAEHQAVVLDAEDIAAIRKRVEDTARKVAALTDDGVVDLDTVRELKQLSERRRDQDK